MTDLSSNFSTIKHQLESLSYPHQRLEQKIAQITQTRNKINNEVINLTKDYERKIKQLQIKLDEAFNKNQALLKQNKLYKKDIEAFQARLIEKERLIAMLVLQQSQRFGTDVRNKSEAFDKGEKLSKRTIEPILPKNITNKEPSNQDLNGNQQQQKKKQPSFDKEHIRQKQQFLDQRDTFQNLNKQETQEKLIQTFNKNQLNEEKPDTKNHFMQSQQQTSQLRESQKPAKKVLPPPPPAKGKKKQYPTIQIQQPEPEKDQKPVFKNQPEEVLGQAPYHNPFEQQNEHVDANQQNLLGQALQNQIQKQIKEQKPTRVAPPPPPQKKSKVSNPPAPKKKINTNIPQPQFLQDHQQPAAENFSIDNQEYYQNLPANNEITQENEGMLVQNSEKFENEQQPKAQEYEEKQNQELFQKYQEIQGNLETQEDYRAPPTNKMVRPSKKKAKTAIKSINQANFYEQTSNSHQQSRQAQSHPIQANQQGYQYEATPSSEDFFAQFGTSATENQHHFQTGSKSHHSHILEAQESSIDYADSHSVVSSSAANMFDSQYFPEESHVPNVSSEIKKMSKKKNTKREIKQLDPGSFN